MYTLFLAGITYYNFGIWFRIDKEHRIYYTRFIINGVLAILTILIADSRELSSSIYSMIITYMLLGITVFEKKNMLQDLKNGRFLKQEKENDKKKR